MEKALRAIENCGLTVDSLLIEGPKVQIKIANVENSEKPAESGDLIPWD